MTTLAERLRRRIALDGPMTLADYMSACLLDPAEGYYATRDPFGREGDFTTAPEISQMFGEMVGLALAQTWLDHGRPAPFHLVELGPGRGTLMADLLRAARAVEGFAEAARIVLIEASPRLREMQCRTIGREVTHLDRLEDLADGPLLVIANEFFDALPIRQFQRSGTGWRERLVGLREDRLALGLGDGTKPGFLEERASETRDGSVIEVSRAAQNVAAEIGRRIASFGGAALVIDYGAQRPVGATFQAVRAHARADPFEAPGTADLTAHVDFGALARAAAPAQATELLPQGVWLERLGIAARAEALARHLTGPALTEHVAAHRRLTHPGEMGTLFKVLGLHAAGHPPPPGFTT